MDTNSTDLLQLINDKCCFPLAEEQIKRKTFFSYTSESLGASVRGSRSHGLTGFSVFLLLFTIT